MFWPNYPHLVSKQAQSQNSRGAGRRNVQKGTGALRISKGASCPWQNPLSVKAVSHSCVGKRFSKHRNPSAKCRFGFGRSELGPESLHSQGCWPAHHTWTSKALGDQSQPSLRTPAALTPASLIISFKLTHSWKKEKQTIKTLILPHLWVSFFQHIMSHCDNYATSSCSTYLQPKKQRPSINTCYIISTHWLLSHSLLKICLFTCLSFPFDYQSRENSLFLVGPHEGWPERSTPCCLLTQPRDFTLKHTTLRFLGRTLNKNIASFLRI